MKKLTDDGFIATWQASDGTVLRTVTGTLPWALEPTTFLFLTGDRRKPFTRTPLLSGKNPQDVLKQAGYT